jgi:hypothetical protein
MRSTDVYKWQRENFNGERDLDDLEKEMMFLSCRSTKGLGAADVKMADTKLEAKNDDAQAHMLE